MAAHFSRQSCGGTRGGAILFGILGVPGKAVAHRMDFDAELFRRNMLAVAIVAGLHELDHAAVQTLSAARIINPRAQVVLPLPLPVLTTSSPRVFSW